MTDEEATSIFERGDVVYGDDPFRGEADDRPWLVLSNHEGRPRLFTWLVTDACRSASGAIDLCNA